jgi:hypothetical protein
LEAVQQNKRMANKYLIYTIVTNNYDKVPKPKIYQGFDYWLFTDDPYLEVQGYETKVLPKSSNPIKQQRQVKILSHEYTKGYSLSIYHDANIELTNNPLQLISQFFKGGMLTTTHAQRSTIKEEAKRIVELNKDTQQSVDFTMQGLSDYPDNLGLWETGIMIRDKSVAELERVWFELLNQYSHRDQLTLPYAAWKTGIHPAGLRRVLMYSFFKLNRGHLSNQTKYPFKIFYSNPFSVEKNIGKAHNDFIKSLNANDEDWIVIQDGDMMYLTDDWGKRISDALSLDGDKFGLVGCYTNRLRGLHQLHGNEFSYETDIKKHYEIAKTYGGEGIQPIKQGVAGVFMAFQYKTWKKVKGFQENSIVFDSLFNLRVRELGLKVGLIRSLYVFHLYRIWAEKEPWNEKKHLLK